MDAATSAADVVQDVSNDGDFGEFASFSGELVGNGQLHQNDLNAANSISCQDQGASADFVNASDDVEWGSPVAFSNGTKDVQWSTSEESFFEEAGAGPETKSFEHSLISTCLTVSTAEDIAAVFRKLEFTTDALDSREIAETYENEPTTAIPLRIDSGFTKEVEETLEWKKSMLELLLYAQLGVAVPRYAPAPKKKKYFTAMDRIPPTPPACDDQEEALLLRASPTDATILDGLYAGVSTTAKLTATTVSAVRRGLGAGIGVVGSTASLIASITSNGSDGNRPGSPRRRTSGKNEADDEKSIFAASLANLSEDELLALGLKVADGSNPNEIDFTDDSLSPEARALAEKMMKMEKALREEELELKSQKRILEIERREEALFPEKLKQDEEIDLDVEDGFSKDMRENGLRHISGSGSEKRIFHESLPEEFDLNSYLSSENFVELERDSCTDTSMSSAAGAMTSAADNVIEDDAIEPPSLQLPPPSPLDPELEIERKKSSEDKDIMNQIDKEVISQIESGSSLETVKL